MLSIDRNKIVYDGSRCCQCGVCLAACPSGALEKHKTQKQYNIEVNSKKCIKCKLCVQVCPAVEVSNSHIPQNALREAKELVLAYAKDINVRKYASSGGVIRTLLHDSLKNGFVNAAYTLLYPEISLDDDGQLNQVGGEAKGYWVSTPPDVFQIPCSLYRPILWGETLKKDLPKCGNVLLVGLPCQLKAAKRLLNRLVPELKILSIAIFCRKNKNFGFNRYIQRLIGAKCNGNEFNVVYRGGGWPGRIRVLTEKVTNVGFFFFKTSWNLSGCNYCCDCTNMSESDLTVTDPWGIVKDDEDPCGQNLVYVWTDAGRRLLETCSQSLDIKSVSLEQASVSFDYKTICEKDLKSQSYCKSGFWTSDVAKSVIKAKLAEIFLSIVPHTSQVFTIIQKIKKVVKR